MKANRERRTRLLRLLDVALILLLVAIMIIGISTLQRFRRHIGSAQMALSQLESVLSGNLTGAAQILTSPEQLQLVEGALATLDSELAAIERLAVPFLPLTPHFGWLPGIGPDLEAAPHLLDMARQVTDAATTLADPLVPLVQRVNQVEAGLTATLPEFVRGIEEAQAPIQSAQDSLANATRSRDQVTPDHLSHRTRALVERFDQVQPRLERILDLLAVLPWLLGSDGPRTYLVLAQNNHEIRATGGFISGVGVIGFDGGHITKVQFQDSYTVDDLSQPHPLAPDDLRRHMGAAMLVLRDANWWPDFPTSAQAVSALYLQDQGEQVDGVVAVDLTTLQLLLDVLGPIEIPDYGQSVTSSNLLHMIGTYWEAPLVTAPGKEGTDWWLHRKDFAADLLAELLSHLTEQAAPGTFGDLAQAFGQALAERHLIIYVNTPTVQEKLDGMGWAGAVRSCDGDYLMVVDSNVGFNKVNPNIEQTIDYQVTVDQAGRALSELTLAYTHRIRRPTPACIHESRYGDDYADLMERCYWDFLRIYLPPGSVIISLEGADEPPRIYEESGYTVVATAFVLENDQQRQIHLTYQPGLPPITDAYRLLVQKQAGTGSLPLRVRIIPPENAKPSEASPPGILWLDTFAVWQGDLARDRTIQLSWK